MNTVDYICAAWDNDDLIYSGLVIVKREYKSINEFLTFWMESPAYYFLKNVAHKSFSWLEFSEKDIAEALEQWYNDYED